MLCTSSKAHHRIGILARVQSFLLVTKDQLDAREAFLQIIQKAVLHIPILLFHLSKCQEYQLVVGIFCNRRKQEPLQRTSQECSINCNDFASTMSPECLCCTWSNKCVLENISIFASLLFELVRSSSVR